MVAHRTLTPFVRVRILLPLPVRLIRMDEPFCICAWDSKPHKKDEPFCIRVLGFWFLHSLYDSLPFVTKQLIL